MIVTIAGAALQAFVRVLHGVDHLFHVGVRHADALWPNSSITSSAVSASMAWLR
jgi:hypothetical protein